MATAQGIQVELHASTDKLTYCFLVFFLLPSPDSISGLRQACRTAITSPNTLPNVGALIATRRVHWQERSSSARQERRRGRRARRKMTQAHLAAVNIHHICKIEKADVLRKKKG